MADAGGHVNEVRYGPHPDQWLRVAQAAVAEGTAARGIAVLVHGGYWRAHLTASLMDPLATAVREAGWHVANVEYRRGPEAVWPAPLDDVREACHAVASWWESQADGVGPIVVIGHSVGGQLALLTAAAATATAAAASASGSAGVDAVVALAPITDAPRTFDEGLGEDAAAEYFGGAPAEFRERYDDASPIRRLPIGRPTLLVHGADDERVPLEHSIAFARAARQAGDQLDLDAPHRLGHLDIIGPANACWARILKWMGSVAD